MEDDPGVYACPLCEKPCPTFEALQLHTQYECNEAKPSLRDFDVRPAVPHIWQQPAAPERPERDTSDSNSRLYDCPKCGQPCQTFEELGRHTQRDCIAAEYGAEIAGSSPRGGRAQAASGGVLGQHTPEEDPDIPCEFCHALFPIARIEDHQLACRLHPRPAEHLPAQQRIPPYTPRVWPPVGEPRGAALSPARPLAYPVAPWTPCPNCGKMVPTHVMQGHLQGVCRF
eukprot:TRINITY_DN875_c0_g1_i6.p2 TRINITY_DN875_c0_g1~~TRINITY_DN875_c0_g1_i6.p2  ORF type:complete len:228 (-),score=21.90 TRINITY_DN875_c0_g1_i6:65-748(-)